MLKLNNINALKKNCFIVLIYATLVLAGGLVGYVLSHSKPSLYAGVTSFILLVICSLGIYRARPWGHMGALVIILLLDAFFTFRYVQTLKFFPPGFMVLISLVTLLILVMRIKKAAK